MGKPGVAAMNVFLGLNKSKKELGLKRQNMWAFTSNDLNRIGEEYIQMDVDNAIDAEIPEWENHLGREEKSTCAIVTLANWEWFKKWEDAALKKRGEIYGLDHSIERFDPLMVAKLRPATDVPGLLLTGQDILSCGFTGALFAGVIGAQAALGRNVMGDLIALHNKLEGSNASITDVRAGVYIEDVRKNQ